MKCKVRPYKFEVQYVDFRPNEKTIVTQVKKVYERNGSVNMFYDEKIRIAFEFLASLQTKMIPSFAYGMMLTDQNMLKIEHHINLFLMDLRDKGKLWIGEEISYEDRDLVLPKALLYEYY